MKELTIIELEQVAGGTFDWRKTVKAGIHLFEKVVSDTTDFLANEGYISKDLGGLIKGEADALGNFGCDVIDSIGDK
ncbi:hypothetical protein [Xenorhabdus cabanillasii]|uniref:Uncharacterized protein n=2 Tax=Xenorhabdus cabanillasii TaxID=351673 RepID=A0A3D9UR46_9GAMM|nr:hypothetical protein [Xenorhabdus cabanillasii]PHM77425.1 hypothetical protein Xcab_01997 [Xenorhabdus cabanillasii JM26]REF28434.1 hypothetical protein BDD26_3335 [Xenorhabdus cabanillasii]CDL83137.1 hypothetical protein XCR1_180007 [Xenorhabdus cabanillasii JM26]